MPRSQALWRWLFILVSATLTYFLPHLWNPKIDPESVRKLIALCFSAYSADNQTIQLAKNKGKFILKSPAFSNNGKIPSKHSRQGGNISPPLIWENPPRGTKSYVLTVKDPDAPGATFTHWVIYNISGDLTGLLEGVSKEKI